MVEMTPCTLTNVGEVWQDWGITKAVMFGRFQPLHEGHIAIIDAVLKTGFDVHIILNGKVNTENNKNPYNVQQKKIMFNLALPQIKPENLHSADVYLGGGGDIGKDLQNLIGIIRTIAPDNEIVIPYARKQGDIQNFLVSGQTYTNIHYVDLLTKPIGPFKQQVFCADMIPDYVDVCATQIRKKKAPLSVINHDVKIYLEWEQAKAEANNRLVGSDPANDRIIIPHPPEIERVLPLATGHHKKPKQLRACNAK